jgi:tRNA dimethylallyltransferase
VAGSIRHAAMENVSAPQRTSDDGLPVLPVLAVVGPTGTGKSDLAVALAHALHGEVINADSMQFYRGMDIGTAKVPAAERGGVPHHLLDTLDIREEASVADFQRRARQVVDEIRGRGRAPIMVGGSGLYVRAALDVLDFPGTDPVVRERLETELEAQGRGPLLARLMKVDPESADRIKDDRRLVRALEVHEVTGRPFSSYMPRREYFQPALQVGLDGDRDVLHERLATRVRTMVRDGLLDEVRRLADHGLREGKTAPRAVGYSQFLRVVEGTTSIETAIEETVVATRQLARRQSTWFRADPRIHWLDFSDPLDENVARVVELFRRTAAG